MCQQKFNIYSPDAYLSLGVNALLQMAFSTAPHINTEKLHFILISGMTLINASKFCYSLNRGNKYVVISDPKIIPLLEIPNGIEVERFIDIRLPIMKMLDEIGSVIRREKKKEYVTRCFIFPLSKRERVVIDYIHRGMSPTLIAKLTKLSIKTVSSQKRSIMKKLQVSSNQQLYIKVALLRYFRVI